MINKLKSVFRRYKIKKHVLEDINLNKIIPAARYRILLCCTCGEQVLSQLQQKQIRAAMSIHGIKGQYSNEEILQIAKLNPMSYIYNLRLVTVMQQVRLEKVS